MLFYTAFLREEGRYEGGGLISPWFYKDSYGIEKNVLTPHIPPPELHALLTSLF
jgi:hypothetical protein